MLRNTSSIFLLCLKTLQIQLRKEKTKLREFDHLLKNLSVDYQFIDSEEQQDKIIHSFIFIDKYVNKKYT